MEAISGLGYCKKIEINLRELEHFYEKWSYVLYAKSFNQIILSHCRENRISTLRDKKKREKSRKSMISVILNPIL